MLLNAILEGSLKGGVILAAAAGLTALMHAGSAAARHLVWGIALIAAAVMPLATRLLPVWRVALPVEVASPMTRVQQSVSPSPAVPMVARQADPEATSRILSAPDAGPVPVQVRSRAGGIAPAVALLYGWLFVAVVLLARLLIGVASLARLTRRAEPVNDSSWQRLLEEARRSLGVRRSVRLLASEETQVPLTWGILRPVVLVTPDYEEWNAGRRGAVLRHELAHVARRDSATHLAAQVICALYWFNPLVWFAARALQRERERACDDRVLAAGIRASVYADELLDIARASLGVERHGAVALAMARRSQLEGRLLSILDPRIRRGVPGSLAAVLLGLAVLGLALPLAAFRPLRQLAPTLEPTPASSNHTPPAAASADANTAAPRPAGQAGSGEVPAAPAPEVRSGVSSLPGAPDLPLVAALPPAPVTQGSQRFCQQDGHSSSHMNWETEESGRKDWRAKWSGRDCSVDLKARGDLKFNDDFTDLSSISAGGYFDVTVREGNTTSRLEVRSEGGQLRRTWSVNGNPQPYGDAARTWLVALLVELDRQTGFAIDARFPSLVRQGGANAVMNEIEQMSSDYVRGLYYGRLFKSVKLSSNEVRRAARRAGETMESDYELGRVLGALAESYALDDAEVRAAFIAAAGTLESDYERAQLLLRVIQKGAVVPEAGRTVVKLVGEMSSDYEKARVLIALSDSRVREPLIIVDGVVQSGAPRADARTIASDYLDVVSGMESDYERGRVLKKLLELGPMSRQSLVGVLEVTRSMSSDYETANVLVALASRHAVDDAVREAYVKAANRMKSDYENQRAMAALARGPR